MTDLVHSLYGEAERKAWQRRMGNSGDSISQVHVNAIVSGVLATSCGKSLGNFRIQPYWMSPND